jgi:hypothetical protein
VSQALSAPDSEVIGYLKVTKGVQERDTLMNVEPLRKLVKTILAKL